MTDTAGWRPGRWWRVIGNDGELWCETSVEREARDSMRPGDTLQRLFEATAEEWRDIPGEHGHQRRTDEFGVVVCDACTAEEGRSVDGIVVNMYWESCPYNLAGEQRG